MTRDEKLAAAGDVLASVMLRAHPDTEDAIGVLVVAAVAIALRRGFPVATVLERFTAGCQRALDLQRQQGVRR